ncbi:MAG: 16S rRNA (cytosine(967)-C(5))-methyltransferase RsmB [Cyanobacteria bacterium SZAS-4]|nr:16S rRNA (cytosine(967)-C(5))-methyltransferase RsmB [Cyanobacteria bacterium SZAS-4]
MTTAITGLTSRKVALETLLKVDKQKAYSNLALNAAFKRTQLSERDRAFVTALVQGVMRNKLHLDEEIQALSKQPMQKLSASVVNILRLSIFQIEEMSDIPQSAVVNVAVELAKTSGGHKGHATFVNGVLRNYLRQRAKATQHPEMVTADIDSSEEKLSTDYSVPQWIVKRWIENFGKEEAINLFKFAKSTPPVIVRTCETAITPDGLQAIFDGKGVKCHRGSLVDGCLIIDKMKGAAEKLPGYAEGLFTVQDEAAAFASIVVEPQKGDFIIDLCAAPGGKTLHLSEMLDNTGRIIAVDKSESRLNLIKKNRTRLGLKNLETAVADGRTYKADRLADKVLLDAPCTGTGVINRRADLRYQRDAVDISSLVELQRELLANAASLIKPGGTLIYSTCSLEPEENFDNIRWFLREFEEFEADDFAHLVPEKIREQCSVTSGPMCKTEAEMNRLCQIQLLPTKHGVSGFFIARMRKKLGQESHG